MSTGLKMLHSDISPSKDNLIFSSMEDLHSLSNKNEDKLTRKNSLNSAAQGKSKIKTHHQQTKDEIHPEDIFQPKRQQQHNIILVQQQQQELQKQQKGILRNNEGKGDSENKIDYETIEELEVETDAIQDQYGPKVITVDDEVEATTSCCWGLREKRRLENVRMKKQKERAAELAKLESLYKLEGDNKRILNLGWEEMVQALQKRELSATAVLEAYTAKAVESTIKYNCITDFIPQAFAWAKELDSLPAPKGPLHGLPFCVKDDTNVKGLDTTLGYVKRLYQPAQENAVIVKSLMDLGAIPFCKTNVPMTLFTYGSDNPVFGATTNCTNTKLSPGGSSSGTGSLVGSHGCLFGTGTDIGGSLRIPAHFNGCSSVKPTVGRLSDKGVVSSLPNLMGLRAVPGIIGQTPSIVASAFKGIVENFKQNEYDQTIPPVPWNESLFQSKKKLRIGYYTNLDYFPSMGDTEEVVLRAKSSLESLGHELVPINMPDPYEYMHVLAKFLLADQNQHFFKALKNEKIAQSIQLSYYSSFIPVSIQKMIRGLMNSKLFPFMYSPRSAVMFGAGAVSSKELWDNQATKTKIIEEMNAEWDRLELDSVISPLFPFPAPEINSPGLLPIAVCYAMLWNLVDYPAGVLPFGRETGKNFDSYDDHRDVTLKLAKKAVAGSVGSPIGVQVIARPFKEEVVLRIMKELEQFSYKH